MKSVICAVITFLLVSSCGGGDDQSLSHNKSQFFAGSPTITSFYFDFKDGVYSFSVSYQLPGNISLSQVNDINLDKSYLATISSNIAYNRRHSIRGDREYYIETRTNQKIFNVSISSTLVSRCRVTQSVTSWQENCQMESKNSIPLSTGRNIKNEAKKVFHYGSSTVSCRKSGGVISCQNSARGQFKSQLAGTITTSSMAETFAYQGFHNVAGFILGKFKRATSPSRATQLIKATGWGQFYDRLKTSRFVTEPVFDKPTAKVVLQKQGSSISYSIDGHRQRW